MESIMVNSLAIKRCRYTYINILYYFNFVQGYKTLLIIHDITWKNNIQYIENKLF